MSAEDDDSGLIDFYPYRARFKTYERLEPAGRDRQSILDELATMAHEEDKIADLGRVSGSIYHGGHDHYAFLIEAFRLFAHANVLQRDRRACRSCSTGLTSTRARSVRAPRWAS